MAVHHLRSNQRFGFISSDNKLWSKVTFPRNRSPQFRQSTCSSPRQHPTYEPYQQRCARRWDIGVDGSRRCEDAASNHDAYHDSKSFDGSEVALERPSSLWWGWACALGPVTSVCGTIICFRLICKERLLGSIIRLRILSHGLIISTVLWGR